MQQHLFVYGTLGPNKPNAHILEGLCCKNIQKLNFFQVI